MEERPFRIREVEGSNPSVSTFRCGSRAVADASLAQSVERKALNLVVVGSSPTGGVLLFFLFLFPPLLGVRRKCDEGGVRTHASEEIAALTQRLRPLGHLAMRDAALSLKHWTSSWLPRPTFGNHRDAHALRRGRARVVILLWPCARGWNLQARMYSKTDPV